MVNFFYLSTDLKECAKWHGDKHLHKMIVEYAQILSSTWHLNNLTTPLGIYKLCHKHHPVVKWVLLNIKHYDTILQLAFCLAEERRRRRKMFPKSQRNRYKKTHATEKVLSILKKHKPDLPDIDWIDPPKCMPEPYHTNAEGEELNVIDSYRLFYAGHKIQVAKLKWFPTKEPEWLQSYKDIVENREDIKACIKKRIEEDGRKRKRRQLRKDIALIKKIKIEYK